MNQIGLLMIAECLKMKLKNSYMKNLRISKAFVFLLPFAYIFTSLVMGSMSGIRSGHVFFIYL